MEPYGMKEKAKRIFRRAVIVVVMLVIAWLSFSYWGVYDDGVRAGIVIRISKKGMLFKTYEGQLNVEAFGALKGVHPIMESFDFSVERDQEQVINDLEAVALTGERVNLHYIKRYVQVPWRGETKYFIIRVERIERKS